MRNEGKVNLIKSKLSRAPISERKRKCTTHFAAIGGRNPSGLGNQIFNFSKAAIASTVAPGEIIAPNYGKGIHEIPLFLKEFSTVSFKLRLIKSRIQGSLLEINQDLYLNTAAKISNWDYEAVFAHLVFENRGKRDFYHCSGMSGGYLGIFSFRDSLKSQFVEIPLEDHNANVIAVHIRGPVQYRSKFYSFRRKNDFQAEKANLKYGDFNSETPVDFYIRFIEELGKFDSVKRYRFVLVTNLNYESEKISTITKSLTANNFQFTFHTGNTVDALKALMTASMIVPSVSSFSLLSIFLSDAKYIWPREALFDVEGFLSIWGYEFDQFPVGPTAHAIKNSSRSELRSEFNYRGLPFPLKTSMDIGKWLSSEKVETLHYLDLIYYGVVSSDI
jgi:hypothetical protein